MDALRAFITNWLDPLGILLGLVALVPIFWTWWDVVFGRRRRERRRFAEISRRPGERPAILIVDLLPGKNVHATVENFRRRDDAHHTRGDADVAVDGEPHDDAAREVPLDHAERADRVGRLLEPLERALAQPDGDAPGRDVHRPTVYRDAAAHELAARVEASALGLSLAGEVRVCVGGHTGGIAPGWGAPQAGTGVRAEVRSPGARSRAGRGRSRAGWARSRPAP